MMIGFLAFGVLVGLTAATLTVMMGGGAVLALVSYATAGSLGLLSMALQDAWSA